MSALQVVLMGVSGTGKSSVAAGLRDRLGWDFVEGDDLHPRENVAKMESGVPLTDEDRAPWLDRVNEAMRAQADRDRPALVTCSALRRRYRDRLREGLEVPGVGVFFCHLHAPVEVLEPRMQQRTKHFMPTDLLASQLDTLEPLGDDEDGAVVDVTPPLEQVVEAALAAIDQRRGVSSPPR